MADTRRTLHIASWNDRFLAWLLDILLVGAVLSALARSLACSRSSWRSVSYHSFHRPERTRTVRVLDSLQMSGGQSVGKMVMSIAVTDERGEAMDYETAAIESFGKAFLLPIDILVGWLV